MTPARSFRPARTEHGPRKVMLVLARFAIGLLIPTLVYYGLRDLGVSVYVSLLVSTLISAAPTVVGLFRRKINALSAYFTTMVMPAPAVPARCQHQAHGQSSICPCLRCGGR